MPKSKRKSKPLRPSARFLVAVLLVVVLIACIGYFAGGIDNIETALQGSTPAAAPHSSPAHSSAPPVSQTKGEALDVYVLDVGQGDSICLIGPSGKTMLVDAGTNSSYPVISSFLNEHNIRKLDVVLATHPHADHIGSMQAIVENYDIGVYYMPDATTTTKTYEDLLDALLARDIDVRPAEAGLDALIEWEKDVEVRILSPYADQDYKNLNELSIICRVRYQDTSVMLTGDAESRSEKIALNELPAKYFRSTVLKVGHHGSSTSSSSQFLDAVSPEIAVISLGAGNTYGHPHEEIVSALDARDIPIYRTDLSGTVHIRLDGTGYTVETQR